MSIRTSEELSDRLAEDLIWRKRELTDLEKLLSFENQSRQLVLVRALVALLYAHWEGYLRTSSAAYFEYLARRRLRYSDLASHFVALGMQSEILKAASQSNVGALAGIIERFRAGLAEHSRIPRQYIDAKSNLSSKVLRDITAALGLDYGLFESRGVMIDEQLLKPRNHIAHGDYLLVGPEDALRLKSEIVALMERFRTAIENAVAQQDYKVTSASMQRNDAL